MKSDAVFAFFLLILHWEHSGLQSQMTTKYIDADTRGLCNSVQRYWFSCLQKVILSPFRKKKTNVRAAPPPFRVGFTSSTFFFKYFKHQQQNAEIQNV